MPLALLLALAVVQGLTEFLPVSSSGHLVMLSSVFSLKSESLVSYYVLVHAGTACAALFFFRKEVKHIVLGLRDWVLQKNTLRARYALKWTGLIVMVSVPTGAAGIFLKNHIESLVFAYMVPVGLFFTAFLLLIGQYSGKKGGGLGSFGYGAAFLVGLAQSFALMPGLSRSGSTIAVALLLGARPNFAGRLSFLSSLTAIFGALTLEALSVVKAGVYPPPSFGLGFVTAFGVGVLSLRFLMLILNTRKLHYFAYYCLIIGSLYAGHLIVQGAAL